VSKSLKLVRPKLSSGLNFPFNINLLPNPLATGLATTSRLFQCPFARPADRLAGSLGRRRSSQDHALCWPNRTRPRSPPTPQEQQAGAGVVGISDRSGADSRRPPAKAQPGAGGGWEMQSPSDPGGGWGRSPQKKKLGGWGMQSPSDPGGAWGRGPQEKKLRVVGGSAIQTGLLGAAQTTES